MATAATELMKDSKGGRGVSEITVRVPGKLFLAGEYAVVHSGHYALVMAINRYLVCVLRRPLSVACALQTWCPMPFTGLGKATKFVGRNKNRLCNL